MLVKRFDEMYTMGIESLVQGGTLQNPYDILKEVNAVAGAIRRFEDEKGGAGGGEGVPGRAAWGVYSLKGMEWKEWGGGGGRRGGCG
jgi:hypothetical protein